MDKSIIQKLADSNTVRLHVLTAIFAGFSYLIAQLGVSNDLEFFFSMFGIHLTADQYFLLLVLLQAGLAIYNRFSTVGPIGFDKGDAVLAIERFLNAGGKAGNFPTFTVAEATEAIDNALAKYNAERAGTKPPADTE